MINNKTASIFTEADNVEPDVICISNERLAVLVDEAGHLTGAPELIVEVLSPGVQQCSPRSRS